MSSQGSFAFIVRRGELLIIRWTYRLNVELTAKFILFREAHKLLTLEHSQLRHHGCNTELLAEILRCLVLMARLLQRWPYEAEPSATGHSQSLYIVHGSVAISTSSIIRDSSDIGNRAINSALLQLIHQTFLLKVMR